VVQPASAATRGGGTTASERALPSWLLYSAAGLLVLALLGFSAVLLVSRRKVKEEAAVPK
jgi:hypothetical protein